jgi:hypothetical protein
MLLYMKNVRTAAVESSGYMINLLKMYVIFKEKKLFLKTDKSFALL